MLLEAGRLCKAQIHHPGSLDHLTEQGQTKCPRATGLAPGTRGALRHITSTTVPCAGYKVCWRDHQHSTTTLPSPSRHLSAFFPLPFQPPLPLQRSGLLLEQESQGRGQKGLARSTAAVGSPLPTTAHSYDRTNPSKTHILRLWFQAPCNEMWLQAATEGPCHVHPQGDGRWVTFLAAQFSAGSDPSTDSSHNRTIAPSGTRGVAAPRSWGGRTSRTCFFSSSMPLPEDRH